MFVHLFLGKVGVQRDIGLVDSLVDLLLVVGVGVLRFCKPRIKNVRGAEAEIK